MPDTDNAQRPTPVGVQRVVGACNHPQCSRLVFNVTYERCPACGHTSAKDQARDNAAIWQACMIQGLLGFDASTKPEQVVARVRELLGSNAERQGRREATYPERSCSQED